MITPLEKPGTPTELVHVGVKGMKWGVRKQRDTSGSPRAGMSTKKKVVIGVGVAAAVVGTGFVAYTLHKNGKLPLSTTAKSGGKVFQHISDIPKPPVSAVAQARRSIDRETYIKLLTSSKKFTPSLAEATRIANETYPVLR